jgi:hypothetical protein
MPMRYMYRIFLCVLFCVLIFVVHIWHLMKPSSLLKPVIEAQAVAAEYVSPTPTPPEAEHHVLIVKSMIVAATMAPTPTPRPVPQAASDLDSLFSRFGSEYNVNKDLLRRIAFCESEFNSSATSGSYGGLYQFSDQSWMITRGNMGLDQNIALRFNSEEAVKTAAFKIAHTGTTAWPNCNK